MALLDKLFGGSTKSNKKPDLKKSQESIIYEQAYTQSKSFKGYKRFGVSYYGYEPAENGLARFKKSGQNLEGADIKLKFVKRQDGHFVDVLINDYLVGSVIFWDKSDEGYLFFKNKFCNGKVSHAHIRFDTETVVGIDKKGKSVQVDRDKIFLFLKVED